MATYSLLNKFTSYRSKSTSEISVKYDPRLNDSIMQIHQSFDLLIEDIDHCIQKLRKIYDDLFYKMNSQKLQNEQDLIKTISSQLGTSQKCLLTLNKLLISVTQDNQNMSANEATMINNLHQSLLQKYSQRVKNMNAVLQIKAKSEEIDHEDQIIMTKMDSLHSSLTDDPGTLMQSLEPSAIADFDFDMKRLEERNHQIHQIAKDVTQLNQMFVDLNEMVSQQGDGIDQVESNIEQTKENVERGTAEIVTAEYYQKSVSSLKNKILLTFGGIIATIGISYGIKQR
jgi:t-SNARE complex subunit (syntaxin)